MKYSRMYLVFGNWKIAGRSEKHHHSRQGVRPLPNNTITAVTVTPTDRFIPHLVQVLARSIHYCRWLLMSQVQESARMPANGGFHGN